MRIKFLAILLVFSFVACDSDSLDDAETSTFIWGPDMLARKSSNQVTLILNDPRPYTNYVAPGPTNPEYFNLFFSENLTDFKLHSKLDISTTSVVVENLNNNAAYYFYTSSHRSGFSTVISDTLMTIPSLQLQTVEIPTNLSFSIENPMLSWDNTYFTFSSPNGPNQSQGYDVLYYKSVSDDSIKTVGANSIAPNWSPEGNQFVYLKNTIEGFVSTPSELRLFDVDNDTSAILMEVDHTKYYINSPQFSKDLKRIDFLSSEDNSEIYKYDLWAIDPDTKAKTKISDFESIGFVPGGSFDWSSDSQDAFLGGYHDVKSDYKEHIYRFNIVGGTLTDIMDSQWRERSPGLSPDNLRISFVSDRSGREELWVYDLDTNEYHQITGEISSYFDSRYSNIQWLNNNELIINTFGNQPSKLVSIKVD